MARRLLPFLMAATVATIAPALAGCGDGDSSGTETPSPPGVPAPQTPPPPSAEPERRVVQVTTILILYRTDKVPLSTRSREEARQLALVIIEKARTGERFEKLVHTYTEDRDEQGEPFNRGSYSLHLDDRRTQPGLLVVAKATPIGQVAPQPYDSGLGYVVLRRDR